MIPSPGVILALASNVLVLGAAVSIVAMVLKYIQFQYLENLLSAIIGGIRSNTEEGR